MLDIHRLFIDVKSLPRDEYGLFQLCCLGVIYGFVLCKGSTLISDGSELLLLVPAVAGIVGSVVLPILGAVPDGCIVFFSGMGPDAQSQLSVGVGALAGSTIMILTIPWFLSILGGRVDFHEATGRPTYRVPKLAQPSSLSLRTTGVKIDHTVHLGIYLMLATSLSYLVIQLPGLLYRNDPLTIQAVEEKFWALLGLCLCVLFFCAYLYYQHAVSASVDSAQTLKRDQVYAHNTSVRIVCAYFF